MSGDICEDDDETASHYVRLGKIDLRRLDRQLSRHINRVLSLHANGEPHIPARPRWEIDPSKLLIGSIIARGTYSTVHYGSYDGIDVAVKLLDLGKHGERTRAEIASARASFAQEVSVWHRLNHPNVTKFIGATRATSEVKIHGHNGLCNVSCVVVEYLPGGTLKNYLIQNRRNKLSLAIVVQLALDLAQGLRYLHDKKIIHRDVKTENLLLDENLRVKIADFGVARNDPSNPADMTGKTGTLGYMAPEVFDCCPYNNKCDVYSFGICLWEIYCCEMPFPNLSLSKLISDVVRKNRRPKIPKCCPKSLANIIKRCWDANPDKRLDMHQVVTMLKSIDTSRGRGMTPLDQPRNCFCFGRFRCHE